MDREWRIENNQPRRESFQGGALLPFLMIQAMARLSVFLKMLPMMICTTIREMSMPGSKSGTKQIHADHFGDLSMKICIICAIRVLF